MQLSLLPFSSYEMAIESAYVIALEGNALSQSLAQRALESCANISQPCRLWPAVDGSSGKILLPESLSAASYMRWPKWIDQELSPTEVACALSHFSLWVRCLEIDRPLIVLEHDAIMLKKLERHPLFHSICYLGGREQARMGWQVHPTPPHATKGHNHHFICRAHAYSIDPAVAKNLVAHVVKHGIHESLDIMIRADLFPIFQPGLYAYDEPAAETTITNRKKSQYGEER